MRTDILIVTCARDMGFLSYCVKSIEQYAHGFGRLVIAVPSHEKGMYDWVSPLHRMHYYEDVPGKGMLQHLVMKCRADEICPEADLILHLDPDCVFWDDATPEDYLVGGKPLVVYEKYSEVLNHHRRDWAQRVTAATGLVPEWETMVRHPQIYHRHTYGLMRPIVANHTGRSFDEYVTSGPNEFPQSFCEFNTLGAVAAAFQLDQYHWEHYNRAAYAFACGLDYGGSWQYVYYRGRDKLVETWSHAGINTYAFMFEDFKLGKFAPFVVK